MDELEVDCRLAAYCVVRDDAGRVLLARWNEVAEPLWAVPARRRGWSTRRASSAAS